MIYLSPLQKSFQLFPGLKHQPKKALWLNFRYKNYVNYQKRIAMKNTILFCMIICILTACTGQRTAQTTNRTNADSTGFGLNTRGINRSIPPPSHRNHPQGSVGMGAPDQIGTAAITELNQDEILKDLLPVKDNTRPTGSSISPLTDKQFITEAY